MSADPLSQLRVVRPKRLYEQVAAQIESLIRKDHLAPGSRLPSERDLAASLGVSRPSLREAMIALETMGLIDVRVGDGTFISERPTGQIRFAFDADLGPGPLEQFEARRAVEVAVAELAAARASANEIAAIRTLVDQMQTSVRQNRNPMDLHRSFHETVARASGNSIFARMVTDLWNLRKHAMWETMRKKVENIESWRAGIATRYDLVDCFERRDGDGAGAAMRRHFDRVGQMYFG